MNTPARYQLPWRSLLAYGGFAVPLSFLALPLYITLPDHYARQQGLGLGLIGVLLLTSRLADAVADPFIGHWVDRQRARGNYAVPIVAAAPLMAGGFAMLFLAPPMPASVSAPWLMIALLLTFAGFSLGSIAYHAWGVELAEGALGQARLIGVREAAALIGMLSGALVPQFAGMTAASLVLAVLLFALGGLLLQAAPRPPVPDSSTANANAGEWMRPLSAPGFRWLAAIFILNGMAGAIPATLMPFFITDVLDAGQWLGPMLALYLLAGAAAMPLWVRLAARIGLAGAWLSGMALAMTVFGWAYLLPGLPADRALAGFAVVVLLSGVALGADLVAPAALLAGVIQRAGDAGRRGGSYFGLWNFGGKLTLALAAGLVLPLLQAFDYAPGGMAPEGLAALTATYCLLPCLFKLTAAALLWRARSTLAGD